MSIFIPIIVFIAGAAYWQYATTDRIKQLTADRDTARRAVDVWERKLREAQRELQGDPIRQIMAVRDRLVAERAEPRWEINQIGESWAVRWSDPHPISAHYKEPYYLYFIEHVNGPFDRTQGGAQDIADRMNRDNIKPGSCCPIKEKWDAEWAAVLSGCFWRVGKQDNEGWVLIERVVEGEVTGHQGQYGPDQISLAELDVINRNIKEGQFKLKYDAYQRINPHQPRKPKGKRYKSFGGDSAVDPGPPPPKASARGIVVERQRTT